MSDKPAQAQFVPLKKYGQNFLTDTNLLSAIVMDAGITKDDIVIEIGAGAGVLTAQLAKAAKSVTAYEIDTRLEPILAANLSGYDNVRVIYGDAMRMDITKGVPSYGYKVTANLPYYITTPILFHFLESANPPKSMSVMVQLEVAERIIAGPGSSAYGALSAAIALRGKATLVRKVGRNMFSPPPNVDSAVVRIDLIENTDIDYEGVSKLIRCAFGMRRKTLKNNLMTLGISADKALSAIRVIGLTDNIRGEALGADDFCRLYKAIER